MSEEDVKIYRSKNEEINADMDKILSDMREHRNNGNLARAKELGKNLGKMNFDFGQSVSQEFTQPEILDQIKALYVFSAEATMQIEVYDPLLYTTAINAMYEEIQNREESFYKKISDGMAYSFYYSEMRKGGDVPNSIGKAFAMLCAAQNDKAFTDVGARLYKAFTEKAAREVEKVRFNQI